MWEHGDSRSEKLLVEMLDEQIDVSAVAAFFIGSSFSSWVKRSFVSSGLKKKHRYML